jgi:hypothetical protein
MKVLASTQALLTGLSRADGFGETSGSAEKLTPGAYTNGAGISESADVPHLLTGVQFGASSDPPSVQKSTPPSVSSARAAEIREEVTRADMERRVRVLAVDRTESPAPGQFVEASP